MKRRLKKKKGLAYKPSYREIKKVIFSEIEREALALEKQSEQVELPKELPGKAVN